MRSRFDEQLETLNNNLIEMGAMIETAIAKAAKALTTQDAELAQTVSDYDKDIDNKEREIESLCLKILLQQQPVAKDLRLVSAALKMITDMERIGDQAADISDLTIFLSDQVYVKPTDHISQMAKATIKMVSESIDAYVKKDLELAKAVIAYDDVVDDLFVTIKKELTEFIRDGSEYGEQAMDFLMIAKYFERIGDHAVNIAEWVVFSIKGQHKDKKIM